MDKIENTLSKPQLTKLVSIFEYLSTTFGLNDDEIVYLLKLYTGYVVEPNIPIMASLAVKNLLTDKNEVNESMLWAGKESIQLSLDMEHESFTQIDPIAEKLIANVDKALLPQDKEERNQDIKKIAQEHFKGDLTQAYYYYMLYYIYPPLYKNRRKKPRWKEHFLIDPPIYTRWYANATYTRRFNTVYNSKSKDIAIFILANYYAMKESIDLDKQICYAITNLKFIENYESWYEYVESVISDIKQARAKKPKQPIKRINKTDTL